MFSDSVKYFKKDQKETKKLNVEINEFKKEVQNNPEKFYEELLEFLK